MPISIVNLTRNERIEPKALFGNDARKFLQACEQIYHDWMHPYDGCYRAPMPHWSFEYLKMNKPEEMTVLEYYKSLKDQWNAEHLDEVKKEIESKEAWKVKHSHAFKTIYGVAKRHGYYIEWFGNSSPCCGDQWEVRIPNHPEQHVARIYYW